MRVYFSGSTRGRPRRCKQQWGRRGKGREGAHGTAHLHGVAEVERVSDIWLAASTSRELRVARRRLAEFRTVKRNVLRCFGRSGTCTDDSFWRSQHDSDNGRNYKLRIYFTSIYYIKRAHVMRASALFGLHLTLHMYDDRFHYQLFHHRTLFHRSLQY